MKITWEVATYRRIGLMNEHKTARIHASGVRC
jgi:hypothetical protein